MEAKALLVVQVSRKMSVVKEMVVSVEEGLYPSGYWRVSAPYVRERKALRF